MSKNKASSKPSLNKGSLKQNSQELSERDLAKVSGGAKFGGVAGESTDKDHKGEIG